MRTGLERVESQARQPTGHGELAGVEGCRHDTLAPHHPIGEAPGAGGQSAEAGAKENGGSEVDGKGERDLTLGGCGHSPGLRQGGKQDEEDELGPAVLRQTGKRGQYGGESRRHDGDHVGQQPPWPAGLKRAASGDALAGGGRGFDFAHGWQHRPATRCHRRLTQLVGAGQAATN